MKARVTQAFKFAHEGVRVVVVPVGAVVTGRCAEVALQEGWGEPLFAGDEARSRPPSTRRRRGR